MDYGVGSPVSCTSSAELRCDAAPSVVEILREKKLSLESRLAETKAALEALEANPELMNVLHLVTKAARY